MMAKRSDELKLCLMRLMILSLMFEYSTSDTDKDKQECASSLVGLATCLPYVGGNAKAPTPDCCSGLKNVLKTNKKCLCLVIKDRNDPDLGLSINVTLALGLPSVCDAPANVSQCPALLHMDPNSPDAQVFFQGGHSSTSVSASPATSPTSGPASSPGSAVAGAPGPNTKSESTRVGTPWSGLGLETVVMLFFLWAFTTPNLIT